MRPRASVVSRLGYDESVIEPAVEQACSGHGWWNLIIGGYNRSLINHAINVRICVKWRPYPSKENSTPNKAQGGNALEGEEKWGNQWAFSKVKLLYFNLGVKS
jgi:hypothetical protein